MWADDAWMPLTDLPRLVNVDAEATGVNTERVERLASTKPAKTI
jgi:hypothetical protein